MRRFFIRAFLVALIPLGLAAAPASADKDIPWGCELVKNTHCHCLSPTGATSCIILE